MSDLRIKQSDGFTVDTDNARIQHLPVPRSDHATLAAIVVGFVCAGCGGSSSVDLAFYDPPDPLPTTTPGSLIRAERMKALAPGTLAWRVLHVSEAVDGTPIAVSGIVAAPKGGAPSGGFNVVAWSHGTKGVSDPCAPSRGFRAGTHDFYDIAPELLAAGYVAVSSDYEALGTPGVHPYLVGISEGRGVLDIIRAASELEEVGDVAQVVVWGRSQGGQGSLFAGELAPSWAPELDLVGVIAAAPASGLILIAGFAPVLPSARGFLWQMTVGFEAAYSELSLESIYSSDALASIRQLVEDEACFMGFNEVAAETSNAGVVNQIAGIPEWAEVLEDNSPGRVRTEVPVLLLQGTDDEVIPIELTGGLYGQLCAVGTEVDYRIFDGFSHNDSTQMNMPLMLAWTADRFAGLEASTTCD